MLHQTHSYCPQYLQYSLLVEVAPVVQMYVPVAQMGTQYARVVLKELLPFVILYLLVLLCHSYLLELVHAPVVRIE